jgi:hypothetical protein
MMLAQQGEFGPEMAAALQKSFRMAPHEGWIATSRVIFGLQVYPMLPPEVRAAVREDLVQIIDEGRLSHIVARAYAADPGLRAAGGDAVRTLPADLLYRFSGIAREAAVEIGNREGAAGE